MTDAVRVKDLFDIPEHVRKTDFVVKLSEGVAHPSETAATYVVTPAIRGAIDGALGLVRTALDSGRSHAAYIQGSFGSGKSHFMAMVSLLMENSDAAWRVPQLHALREKHAWLKGKSVLQLRFHMVGQKSLEAAIFGEYVRWVRANKPEAPIPPLFADEALFEDARRLLDQLGEEKFFAPMNPSATDARWGKRAATGLWTRERFDETSLSSDPAERAKFFDALARTHFKAFAQQREQFVDVDSGLAALGRHAKSLGYDAVILLLDELVLWLASGASNASWLHNEVQKAAKLVEAQNSAREIPIVSFIARQRDLADLVGDDLAGAENQRLRESLAWFKDRFERVELGDNNLPDIVSERILHAKNDAAKKELDDAFKALQAKAGSSWTTLLGTEDAAAFRKLYPFSPAIVETLVALSNSLQRNRTAIRLLMELLVEYIPDLTVGEVVPVGDLYDVLAGGDDTTDGVMRAHFEQARQLYSYKLLPMIQEQHGTTMAARCQRLRPEHRASLGCSGCPEAACRADNRLVKTLLLAALAPAARTLKGLTVGRLVQLNHGTLRAMIPGTEAMTAASRLRHYASTLGQLHVGTQPDPSVDIDVAGVDLEPILQQSRDADTPGARQKIVRDILFENLGLDPSGDWGQDDKIDDWRGTVRKGHVRFTNVRRATPEMLRCAESHDWRLVLDYPFDDAGFGPNDDLAVVERMREEGEGTWTLVMLPSFFSDAMNKLLGELAILDHVLASKESKRVAVQHLRPEQQPNAEMGLENLRTQKRARLYGALLEAYGLTRETEANIDPSRSIGRHFLALKPEVKIRMPLGGTLAVARTTCIPELLAERFPRHPNLRKLTKLVVERVLERFADLLERDGKPLELDKDDLEKVRGTLGELGIVKTSEGAAHLVTEGKLQDLEQRRRQRNVDQPTAAEVRGWVDEGRKMGLQPDAQDLIVRAYATWSARTFVLYGKPYTPAYGAQIPDDAVLEKPELPTQSEWVKAIDLAGHTFGITLPRRALNADNVKRFEVDLAGKLQKLAGGAAKMVPTLERRLAERGVSGEVDRLVTARSGAALCTALEGKKGVEQVRAVASFEPQTSAKAVGIALLASAAAVTALEDKLFFGAFARLPRGVAGAETILEEVERALRLDELNEALAPALRRQAEAANELLTATQPLPETPPVPPVPVAPAVPPIGTRVIKRDATKSKAREVLAAVVQEVEAALKDEPADVSVAIEVLDHEEALNEAPHLSLGDIEQRLRELFREHRRSHLVAFHGQGDPNWVDVGELGRFHVVPVSSELELRKLVPNTLAGDPRCAFLVPFTGRLPLDIGCFFADDGRIFTLGRDLRLKRMFDATEVEPAARESALARFLLERPPQPSSMPRFGGRLTFDSLWAMWLSTWGLPVEGLSLESLMAWACVSDVGPKFRTDVPEEVRQELMRHLVSRTGGPVARVVWTAWESGRDRTKPFELGLLFDGMREPGGDLRGGELLMWRRIKLKELGLVAEAERDVVARELADRAPATFRILHARDTSLASKLLLEAEGHVDEDTVRAALVGSALLPNAWGQRLDALGAALSEAATNPGLESLERVRRARKDLEAHQLFKDTGNQVILERAEMAVRLAAWLVARTDRGEHPTATNYSEAEWLARWYSEEGGFIDWARRRARGSDARPFGRGANAIVAAVDEARVQLDRTFARALREWLKAGSPENAIVSIEHAVERFAVRFLAERGDRRLLVLLLDGMAWAQAVEILGSLKAWGLLSWRAVNGDGASFAPVIASLPTVTEVSRAAFFAGKRTPPGRAEPTDKDPERWAAHAKLRSFVPRGEAPRLLLRAEGHTTSGAVSSEALSLVADTEQRVVGIVINAIDASLKADTQQRMYWTASHIQSLPELLEAAQAAGRAVLLAADHGHIAADHLESVPAATDSKPRWRVWKDAGEPLAEYEVGFEKSIAWAPPGAHGVVLLADDAHRYGGGAHTGEHGGATLAEVVAPAILVGADTLAGRFGAADEDVALRVSTFPEPGWWYPMVSSSPAGREAVATAPKRRHTPKPARAANQLDLLQSSLAPAASPPAPHPLRTLIARSRVFMEAGLPEARKGQVLTAIDFLARRDGEQAPLGAFAVAMGTVATRARGLVEVLAERLNVDGFMLLSYDAASDLVKLDAAKLKQIYGDS